MSKLEINFMEQDLINLDDYPIVTIVIENRSKLFEIEENVRFGFDNKSPFFRLYIDKENTTFDDNCHVIDNFFNLDLHTKKNINILYKILKNLSHNNIQDDLNDLKKKLQKIVDEIALDFDIELLVNKEIDEGDLFKIVDLRFSDIDSDPKIRLLKYVQAINEIQKINLFFTFRFHEYFEDKDIEILIKELNYRNIKIINIESKNDFNKLQTEKVVILDNDLCYLG